MSQTETTFDRVLAEIAAITGFSAHEYRPTTLKRRLELRLSATNSKSYSDYIAYLQNNPLESYRFLDALFIMVTDFFRDRAVFSYLEKEVFPSLIDNVLAKRKGQLAIWSVGCSQGQEAYSLAMSLDLVRRKKKKRLKISILATDVSTKSLALAKKALYRRAEMKNIPPKCKHEFCKKLNSDRFRIIDRIRKMVRFKQHDFIREASPGKFDLISCRNMLIFFTADGQSKMFRKLHSSLKNLGILVLGTAEAPKEEGLFECLSQVHHVYRKIQGESPGKAHFRPKERENGL